MKRVVLVRPAGPRNVGSVLRATANFGPAEIVLVAPRRPSILIHPDFEQMAHGALDAAKRIRVVATLHEALSDITHAIGFTARTHQHRAVLAFANERARWAELSSDPDHKVALVFGAEEGGLATSESELCHELAYIATGEEHGSLNLAMAVTVVLYDLFRHPVLSAKRSRITYLSGAERAYLIANVAATLQAAATSKEAGRDIAASVERVFGRATLEARDARAWHQIMRALGNRRVPGDYGLAGVGTDEARGTPQELDGTTDANDAAPGNVARVDGAGVVGAGDARESSPPRRDSPHPA
jgi:TrmH family RNA methyltransferase